MQNIINIMNSLADDNRLRLFMSLSGRELCVCQLVDFIGLADSTVSKHMSILKQAGLVESRKCGKWVYYRLADANASPLVRRIIEFAQEYLADDRIVVADQARLVEMLRKDDGTACQPNAIPCSTTEPDSVSEMA